MIDLGVLGEQALPSAGRPRLRMPATVLLVIVLVATLTASVRPTPNLRPLWSGLVGYGRLDIGIDTLYLAEASDGGGVVAYRLRTGQRRWRVDLADTAYGVGENGSGQAIVVSGASGEPETLMTSSVDVASGRLLNSSPGTPLGRTADGAVYLLDATGPERLAGTGLALVGFRPGGGGPLWSIHEGGTGQVWIDRDAGGAARWIVIVAPDGQVRVWRPDSGTPMGTYHIPPASPSARPAAGPITAVVEGRLLTVFEAPGGLAVSAYRLPDLVRQWVTVLPPGVMIGDDYAFGGCGDLLCVRRSTSQTEVLDPATGRLLVRTDGDVYGHVTGGQIAAVRFIRGGGETQLYDPPTGRRLGRYPGWILTEWPVPGGSLLYREVVGATAFALVTPAGVLRPLGSVPGTDLSCQARADVLACLDPAGLLRVWQLRHAFRRRAREQA